MSLPGVQNASPELHTGACGFGVHYDVIQIHKAAFADALIFFRSILLRPAPVLRDFQY